jgi:DNA-binding IclR family transcriptional regulator
MRPKLNAQPNKSLIDGITALQALATSSYPVGCRELARRLKIDAVKVNRLLKTLCYLGIARQAADVQYTAGSGMHALAAQSLFASGLIRHALPSLESLQRFGHIVALGVLWQDSVSYLLHAPPSIDASRLVCIGLLPATTSSIGIVLLSEYDDVAVRELYRGSDTPMFPQGIDRLFAKLEEVRTLGYARVRVADAHDHHSIAVSTGDPAHAAVAVSGWIPEVATAPLVEALRAAAADIGG